MGVRMPGAFARQKDESSGDARDEAGGILPQRHRGTEKGHGSGTEAEQRLSGSPTLAREPLPVFFSEGFSLLCVSVPLWFKSPDTEGLDEEFLCGAPGGRLLLGRSEGVAAFRDAAKRHR